MCQTASGKTAVPMALADRFPVELISVDSAQVFSDMNAGTANPERAMLARFAIDPTCATDATEGQCNHGRPTRTELTLDKLDKLFQRCQ